MGTTQRMAQCQTSANTNRSGDSVTASRFDIVTLNSPRTNELAKFWAELLGLQEIEREDGDRWILLGDANGGRTIGFQRGDHVAGSIHIDLSSSADDFQIERERILRLGAVETRLKRSEPYCLIANFADVDGNLFDLCAYISAE
jgi:catechol 2,3-dioxygenase-like lactoylglutathione lyase family enzyme